MNAVIITQQNYDELISRLDRIQQEVSNKQKSPVVYSGQTEPPIPVETEPLCFVI